jgi:transcriptional regulator with XRE-family HTH domain
MPATPSQLRAAQRWTTVLNGYELRRLRTARGLSQERLASRAGISLTSVVRLERRPDAACRPRTLARLARALGEDPAALITGQPPAGAARQSGSGSNG